MSLLSRKLTLRHHVASFLLLNALIFGGIFIFIERQFLTNVVTGDFPILLFIEILPAFFFNFLTSDNLLTIHYLIISSLLSVYVMLLWHMFVSMRYISFSSLGISLAGLAGITLGVTCISCGAVAGLLLISTLGVLSLPVTLAENTSLFLIGGEFLLILSILLLVFTLRKFNG